jgi:protoporphyrin/coproporphyrin ferrochelatase
MTHPAATEATSPTGSTLATPATAPATPAATRNYDAILVVSFGGPEGRDDVIPFLENVLRGKPVPRERMLEVAEHYYHFDGISPINDQVRDFITGLRRELDTAGIDIPIYWGNRNWHPYLTTTLEQMKRDGVRRALAYVTSGYSCYSGCRQYRENIQSAREQVGPDAPVIDKIRVFYNHPDFVRANADRILSVAPQIAPTPGRPQPPFVLFTAHSIPLSMSNNANYVLQLSECCRLVAQELQLPADRWQLVYQSRSGRPQDPWLEPDVLDRIRELHSIGERDLIIMPLGFLSDHMEVLYDLDEEAAQLCQELGITMRRAPTVGTHPLFLATVRELIQERLGQVTHRRAIGHFGPNHDVCPANCCLYEFGRPTAGRPTAATESREQSPGARPA